jgi:HlyD family secretion protein
VKGSDKSISERQKEEKVGKMRTARMNSSQLQVMNLKKWFLCLQKDGTVKKVIVKSGIQDLNYIEIISGLKWQ